MDASTREMQWEMGFSPGDGPSPDRYASPASSLVSPASPFCWICDTTRQAWTNQANLLDR